MDWNKIDKLLKDQIKNKPDIRTGYEEICQMLTDYNLSTFEINIPRLEKEFNGWLSEVINQEPIPREIKSLYFGLANLTFPDIFDGKEVTTVYIAGSIYSPNSDEDWACDTTYFPQRRYLILNDFEMIFDNVKANNYLDGDYEVLVFNGLLNLLLISFIKQNKVNLNINIGAGFDSGDVYLIKNLTND